MPDRSAHAEEIKRKIRELKKLELKIRFGGSLPAGAALVWDTFFDLHEDGVGRARYWIWELCAMDGTEYKNAINEYFFHVYFRYYKENGITDVPLYDPVLLSRLGLAPDADTAAVKRRFRELALRYHPDTGGDGDSFIELMETYRSLLDQERH